MQFSGYDQKFKYEVMTSALEAYKKMLDKRERRMPIVQTEEVEEKRKEEMKKNRKGKRGIKKEELNQ